jgi:hypothetical protein
MYFCSGQPMHFCSGVDTRTTPGWSGRYERSPRALRRLALPVFTLKSKVTICWLSTLVFPLRLCFGDALPLPFKHHLALELGHRGKHVEH